MRAALTFLALAALFASRAGAFDRAEWLGKRGMLDGEAGRLEKAYAKYAAEAKSPAENVTVPVDSFDDGTVKTSLYAEKAQYFASEGFVWGAGVILRQVRADGSVEAEVRAANCIVDRETRSGWAEGAARADYDGKTLVGTNVYFSLAEKYFKVCGRTMLEAEGVGFSDVAGEDLAPGSRKKPKAGAEDAKKSPGRRARLTGRRADYDNAAGVILFDGEVTVDDGEYRLGSDLLWVFLDGTNELRRIEASGHVTLTNAQRSAECVAATYDRRAGRLVMTGDPAAGASAKLRESGERQSEIAGSRIVFWLDSEQVEVENSTVTIGIDAKGGEPWKKTL